MDCRRAKHFLDTTRTALVATFCLLLVPYGASAAEPEQPPSTASSGASSTAGSALLIEQTAAGERSITSPAAWQTRRVDILRRMQEAMGPLPQRGSQPEPEVKILDEVEGEGFRRLTISILAERRAEKEDRIPAYLYLPKDRPANERRPALLALHPTSPLGKGVVAGLGPRANRSYGLELAQRGYVVLCPDYPSFGDYPYDFESDDYVSGTMKGIFNHMRCVDYLVTRAEVDPQRIGVIGHSLGGHNAIFVGAFDERLKVIVSSCGWTPFGDYYGGKIAGWTSPRYMPRLRTEYQLDPAQVPFDFPEVIATLAPRAFFTNSPLHDDNFAVAGVRRTIPQVQQVYQLFDAEDQLQARYPDAPHDFPTAVREEAYEFIDRVLDFQPSKKSPDDFASELPRIPPRSPAESLKLLHTLPGFRVELVAAEPLLRDPVALTFDENGRMFVVEMCDYSEQADEHLGTVRLLEDTDGDGTYDRSTLYAEGLSWPTAIIAYEGGVFVGAAPDIFYLKDTDGDGRADVRKTVFTGFRRTNVQGLLNSFRWGLDNRIHGATSVSGGTVQRADEPQAKPVPLTGRDFSFDPRTLELRAESGGAQHGLSFDDWGRKFVCSNSDHIQMVMFEDRYVARNPALLAPGPRVSIAADGPAAEVYRLSPVEPWRIVRTRLRVSGAVPGVIEGGGRAAGYFTGATGATIYRGDAWPDEYRGQAFIGDVGGNLVHRKVLEPSGVGFTAQRVDQEREFVASEEIWFRPAQFANAPDGTLYILDVYREVIEHPASLPPMIKKHLDLTSGRDRGRIYRIVADNKTPRQPPQLGAATVAELVQTLAHRNGWHRDTAARLLYERQDRTAQAPLEQLAQSASLPEARMHALHALQGLGLLSPELVLRGLRDEHPGVREHAIRLAEPFLPDASPLVEQLCQMVADDAPRVRYQLAFTLGQLPGSERAKALAALARRDSEDRWMRLAILSSLAHDRPAIYQELASDASYRATSGGQQLLLELVRQIGTQKENVEVQAIVAATLALVPPAADHENLPLLVSLLQPLDEVLKRQGHSLPAALQGSAQAARVATLIDLAQQTALDSEQNAALRAAAIRLIVLDSFEQQAETFATLLDPREPLEVQESALAMLGQYPEPKVATLVLETWPTLGIRLRTKASELLASRTPWLLAFLQQIEAGQIALNEIDSAQLQLFRKHRDASVRKLADDLTARLQISGRKEVLAAYQAALTTPGDVDRGRKVFTQHCAACHRLEGQGFEIGPDLKAVRNRGAEFILTNVLDPNVEVNPQYLNYLVLTTAGRTSSGLLAAETATSITLQRGENVSESILRTEIEEMRSTGLSLMPEGLEKQIDVQAMADLIAYLLSLK